MAQSTNKAQKSIFIDADAFISLHHVEHVNNLRSIQTLKSIENESVKIITCSYVILEAATILSMYIEKTLGSKFAHKILYDSDIKVISGDKYLGEGINIMRKQSSKNISLNDCVYFAICKELEIKEVFSYDVHWKKNGFKLI